MSVETGGSNHLLHVPNTHPLRKEDAVSVEFLSPSRGKKGGREGVNVALASPLTSRKRPLKSVPLINNIQSGGGGEGGGADDDDVFKVEPENDKKLVDWVMNVFVPACKSLLEQCSMEPVVTSKVQTYLRLLGNTITFFCNEHQSPVVSPSRSISDLLETSHSRETTPIPDVLLSPPSQPCVAKQQDETSVAMKVLRSVSSSLLPPLLAESQEGFNEELYRKIIVAIQKISWKVEACLSYSSPDHDCNIHKIIFDGIHTEKISQMMITAPPEEHKLQNSPSHVSRLGTKQVHSSPSPLRFVQSLDGSRAPPNSRITPSPTMQTDDEYFRPTRRTTVSISKTQVQNLGLNMADVANLDSSHHQHRSNTIGISTAAKLVQDEGVTRLHAIREKVLRKLAKEFPHLEREDSIEKGGVSHSPSLSHSETPRSGLPSVSHSEEPFSSSTPLTLSPSHSCGSPSYFKENSPLNDHSSSLRDRTQSLEFDQLMETVPTSPTGSASFSHHRPESRMSEPPEKGSSTMPHKRRGTFMKMIKNRKVRSFGRADHKTKHRVPLHPRNKSASEFFSLDRDRVGGDTIECYSRGAIPSESFKRESVYLNVEVQNKSVLMSPRRRKLSVSANSKANRSSFTLEINVSTNFPEFEEQVYSISRPLKEVSLLYDIIASNMTAGASTLPDKPDKKNKEWKQQSEDFLLFVAHSSELRSIPEFIEFIRPGDINVSLSQLLQKDTELELLATFFTPAVYSSGDAGTHHHVDLIKDNTTPAVASSSRVRYNYPSLSNGRGSVMIEKQEGEEETTFVIREGDQDALIISESQNRFLIIAGTFEKLVEQLACEEKPDPYYVSTFILGYRHFGSPIDLVTLLIKRFQMTVAPDATEEEVAYAEKWRYVIQLRVLDIFTYWIKSCFPDFLLYSKALDKLKEFIDDLKQSEDSNFSSAATVLSSTISDKLDAYHNRRSVSSSSSSQSPSPYHSRSLSSSGKDIHSFSAIQLARQLTLIELEYLKAIDVYEVAVYTWESGDGTRQFRKNLDAYIGRFNKVSYWVASEILSVGDEKLRASLIEKFVETAKHCQELKNFNTTVSLVTGLSISSIRRLSKTWKLVNERLIKSFTKLKLLTNPANNHQDYRKAMSNVSRRDCIPYFGVFMRDVTLCNYGNPKKLKNGLYNFSKLRILVQMFEEIYQYQRSKYYHPSDDRVQAFCTNLWSLDEPELYELSLQLEPREELICESDY